MNNANAYSFERRRYASISHKAGGRVTSRRTTRLHWADGTLVGAIGRAGFSVRHLVGNYEMTIEIGEQCSKVVQTVRRRTYDVALENSGHFVYIRLVDRDAGDLGGSLVRVSPPEPNVLYLNWNDDIGCLYPEVTAQGPLYVCGAGRVTLGGSTLSGVIAGAAYFEGAPTAGCIGPSLLTVAFVRH